MTRTCRIRPSPNPSTAKYTSRTTDVVVSVSVDSRYRTTVMAAVPTIGYTLYRPNLEISWPLAIDVTSRPSTIGSRYTPEIVGVTPRTTCRYSGRNAVAPNSANPAPKLMPAPTENTGFRNRRRGSTGSAARPADSHQPTASTTAPAPSPKTSGDSHGYVVPPHEVSSTTQVAAAASSTVPE